MLFKNAAKIVFNKFKITIDAANVDMKMRNFHRSFFFSLYTLFSFSCKYQHTNLLPLILLILSGKYDVVQMILLCSALPEAAAGVVSFTSLVRRQVCTKT